MPAALSRRLDPRAGAALVWGSRARRGRPERHPLDRHGRRHAADARRRRLGRRWGSWSRTSSRPSSRRTACSAKVEHLRGVPPVVNDHVSVAVVLATRRARCSARTPCSPTRQSLGGEDFAWYLTTVPGAMVRLGTRTPGGRTYDLHQGDLTVDERRDLRRRQAARRSALGCSVLAGRSGA